MSLPVPGFLYQDFIPTISTSDGDQNLLTAGIGLMYLWKLLSTRSTTSIACTKLPIRNLRRSTKRFLPPSPQPNKPVIITGMMDDWKALQDWNRERLLELYGQRLVKVLTELNPD